MLNYKFDARECGLFKPWQEGYFVVVLKSHEAMQCFCSWVDAGSVPSLSTMLLALRFIVKSIICFFYCMWLNMMILHVYHDDSNREVMGQGV